MCHFARPFCYNQSQYLRMLLNTIACMCHAFCGSCNGGAVDVVALDKHKSKGCQQQHVPLAVVWVLTV